MWHCDPVEDSYHDLSSCRRGEMADARDLKSLIRKGVRVRVPAPALSVIQWILMDCAKSTGSFYFKKRSG